MIKSVIKNYDSYDIFKHKEEMEKQILTNNLNPSILSKIEEVRDVNQQIAEAVAATQLLHLTHHTESPRSLSSP